MALNAAPQADNGEKSPLDNEPAVATKKPPKKGKALKLVEEDEDETRGKGQRRAEARGADSLRAGVPWVTRVGGALTETKSLSLLFSLPAGASPARRLPAKPRRRRQGRTNRRIGRRHSPDRSSVCRA